MKQKNKEQNEKDEIMLSISDYLHIETNDAFYQIVEDLRKSESPMVFELENINNPDDCFKVTELQIRENLGKSWFRLTDFK